MTARIVAALALLLSLAFVATPAAALQLRDHFSQRTEAIIKERA